MADYRPIKYEELEEISYSEEIHTVIWILSSEHVGFLALLEQNNLPFDVMCLILSIFENISNQAIDPESTQPFVRFFLKIIRRPETECNLHRELKLFVSDLITKLSPQNPDRDQYILCLEKLLNFLRKLQQTIYRNSFSLVSSLVPFITAHIEYINQKENCLSTVVVDLLTELNRDIDDFDEVKKKTEKEEVLLEPPEDFRELTIYPNEFDILKNRRPFLRENILNGKYFGGVDHYLDIQFRLLREDFIRPLREGIHEYTINIENHSKTAYNNAKQKVGDLNIYRNVHILSTQIMYGQQAWKCEFNYGPLKNIQCHAENNKRLLPGSMVCLSSDDFKTFFIATIAALGNLANGIFFIQIEKENYVTDCISPFVSYVMVESPVYFEAYRHILKVLQSFNENNFPLKKYIVDVEIDIVSPPYLDEGSRYVLYEGNERLPSYYNRERYVQILTDSAWPERSFFGLDESQFNAFRAALTKQFVIIQGPPGTGKTHIGLQIIQALLGNFKKKSPIMVICYTNHALDQFLEKILPFCEDLVRIGGNSNSTILEEFNLSEIRASNKADIYEESETMSYSEKMRFFSRHPTFNKLRQTHQNLKNLEDIFSGYDDQLKKVYNKVLGDELNTIIIRECNVNHVSQLQISCRGNHLLRWLGYEHVYSQDNKKTEESTENQITPKTKKQMDNHLDTDSKDEQYSDDSTDGFRMKKGDLKKMKQHLKRKIREPHSMSLEEAENIEDINELELNDRWRLYRLWLKLFVEDINKKRNRYLRQFTDERDILKELRKEEDLEIVRTKKVIGITTTGAAKYRHIITGTQPKILIVEEAAEVLEAHIITALCKSTEHLILIGDHQQLRPNPAVYDLAVNYKMDISLFERLIKNGLNYYQLKQQHRMRPCISSLLVPHIYKELIDHPDVMDFENIRGVGANMYFINHNSYENSLASADIQSHSNKHEAVFIVELARFLILQAYCPSQITILTTYNGQLNQIKRLTRYDNILDDVLVTVVDNYQGEENDIILLSLVRSNADGNIGFLKISNRVNVALSRAKMALYCIGNFTCMTKKSSFWQSLVEKLKSQEAFGDKLLIYCQNHPNYKSFVASGNEFKNRAPDGGCQKLCESKLPCGHACPNSCHSFDMNHIEQICPKRCKKIVCKLKHSCQKLCHYNKECDSCKFEECLENKSSVATTEEIETDKLYLTEFKADTELDSSADSIEDLSSCSVTLMCGHFCEGTIAQCKQRRLHVNCNEKCKRILICGHVCEYICGIDCPPCRELNCFQLCNEICYQNLSKFKCTKKMVCGHKCVGVCDNECSNLCYICNENLVDATFHNLVFVSESSFDNQMKKIFNQIPYSDSYFDLKLRTIYCEIRRQFYFISKKEPLRKQMLLKFENIATLAIHRRNLFIKLKSGSTIENQSAEAITFEQRLNDALSFLITFQNGEQQKSDILNEISFLTDYYGPVLFEANARKFYEHEQRKRLQDALQLVNTLGPATYTIKKEIKKVVSDLKILPQEKCIIVMHDFGFQRDHWNKCPDGHISAISNCGGSVVKGKCFKCEKSIDKPNYLFTIDEDDISAITGAMAITE